jgi:hypothetical protein
MNNFVCKGERSDIPDSRVAFVFDEALCSEAYVRGAVLARFEGSGRLARMWFTALSIRSAPADREIVRIYLDDEEQPEVEVPLSELLSGAADEMFSPPFGAGSPRRVAWYYPVVFGKKLIVALDRLGSDDLYFHQTAVVLDDPQAPRARAARRLAARDDALALLRSSVPLGGTPMSDRLVLDAGQARTTHRLRGPATIVAARVRIAQSALTLLGGVRLRVAWDDDDAPAIDLPLSELFAAIDAPPEPASLALASRRIDDDIELSLRLPMPFGERASWTVENSGDRPIRFALTLEVAAGAPAGTAGQSWGKLHVVRHRSTAGQAETHPLVSAHGRGRLIGVCTRLRGHGLRERGRLGHPMHFLEGDERATIDGVGALSGTGTEDYFNGSFYFDDGAQATPFSQVWGIVARRPGARHQAQVHACRWHVLGDAIDYRSALELELEVGPGSADVLDDYISVAYLYR